MKSKFASEWEGKKEALKSTLEAINKQRIANGEKPHPVSVIHGHHIVMKGDKLTEPAAKILEEYGIPVLLKKSHIRNAESLDDLANISMALNIEGTTGIHGETYANAVNEGLQAVVDLGKAQGLSKAEIKAKLIEQLAEWRDVLEEGGTFW